MQDKKNKTIEEYIRTSLIRHLATLQAHISMRQSVVTSKNPINGKEHYPCSCIEHQEARAIKMHDLV